MEHERNLHGEIMIENIAIVLEISIFLCQLHHLNSLYKINIFMNILKTNYRTICVCKPVSITFHKIKIGQIHSTN